MWKQNLNCVLVGFFDCLFVLSCSLSRPCQRTFYLLCQFPVRSACGGGTLQAPLCPQPRPFPRRWKTYRRNYKGKESDSKKEKKSMLVPKSSTPPSANAQWAGGRTSRSKYRLPKSQRPDGTVAASAKMLALRFYQLKTGHCLTGQYLNWTKNRPTSQCWWCRYRTQTQDHLFKECPEWKPQQKILWVEVKKQTGRWKGQ